MTRRNTDDSLSETLLDIAAAKDIAMQTDSQPVAAQQNALAGLLSFLLFAGAAGLA